MLPQLDPTWYASQSFWMLVTFCAMFLTVWRLVMPAMRATVDVRRSKIEEDIKQTEILKTEAARLLKELDAARASVRENTARLMAQAQEQAQAQTAQSESEFTARLNEHIVQKEQALKQARESALREVAAISGELADAIVRKIGGITVPADEIRRETASVMEKSA